MTTITSNFTTVFSEPTDARVLDDRAEAILSEVLNLRIHRHTKSDARTIGHRFLSDSDQGSVILRLVNLPERGRAFELVTFGDAGIDSEAVLQQRNKVLVAKRLIEEHLESDGLITELPKGSWIGALESTRQAPIINILVVVYSLLSGPFLAFAALSSVGREGLALVVEFFVVFHIVLVSGWFYRSDNSQMRYIAYLVTLVLVATAVVIGLII